MSKETTLNEALKQINCIKAFQTCRSIFRIMDPQLIRNACEKARQFCQSFWEILNKTNYITFAFYCCAFKLLWYFATSAKLLNFSNSVTPSQFERANSEHFLRNVEQLHWKQFMDKCFDTFTKVND